MGKVKNILKEKGNAVYAITPDKTVYDALEVMVEKNLGAMLVMEDDQLLGIFTERDYARKLVLKGKSSKETPIGEVMTQRLITVTPDDSVDHCMGLMVNSYIRHLPVLDQGRLVGLVSIGDVVKQIINDQKHIIDSLHLYISDSR